MKLKLLLLYSIHATYGRIQMTEMPKSLKKTSMVVAKPNIEHTAANVGYVVNLSYRATRRGLLLELGR